MTNINHIYKLRIPSHESRIKSCFWIHMKHTLRSFFQQLHANILPIFHQINFLIFQLYLYNILDLLFLLKAILLHFLHTQKQIIPFQYPYQQNL